jgi:hypothetical protein
MYLFRDSLRTDVRRLKRRATVIERTSIEDRRRRLEGRIKTFHTKADTLMVGVDLDDVGPMVGKEKEVVHEWDDVEELEGIGNREGEDEEDPEEVEHDEAIGGPSASEDSPDDEDIGADQPGNDDEEDNMEYAECLSLCMPSSLGQNIVKEAGLETLALQEIELRLGQANDALGDLRVELGHKSLLYRTKLRYSKNTKGKTRAWKEVNKSSMEVMKHVRRYERARRALVKLGVEDEILQKFQDIKKEDLKMSADILEENRFGQKNTTMAWFWRLGPQGDSVGNDWMQECEYRVTCV